MKDLEVPGEGDNLFMGSERRERGCINKGLVCENSMARKMETVLLVT